MLAKDYMKRFIMDTHNTIDITYDRRMENDLVDEILEFGRTISTYMVHVIEEHEVCTS